MFSGANELPTHLLSPDGRGHSYDSSTTALGQCHRFKGGVFQWIGQKVRVEDLTQGRNGVGVAHDWWPSTHPLNGSLNGTGNEKEAGIMKDANHDMASLESFRSGYPGVYGTLLRDAIKGKADDELVERPEMRVFKMAMVGAGEAGLMAEYDGAFLVFLPSYFFLSPTYTLQTTLGRHSAKQLWSTWDLELEDSPSAYPNSSPNSILCCKTSRRSSKRPRLSSGPSSTPTPSRRGRFGSCRMTSSSQTQSRELTSTT